MTCCATLCGLLQLCQPVQARSHPCLNRLTQQQQHQPLHNRCRTFARGPSRDSSPTPEDDSGDGLPPLSNVQIEKRDMSIIGLAEKVKDKELDLQPTYQRGLVWNKKMASRLVVTALEERVVPTLYMEEGEDRRWSVMDGKQRLASLISFFTGDATVGGLHWSQAPAELEITDDTSCDIRWHGKTFSSLPEDRQRAYKNYAISCVIVNSKTDRDVVFNIYQDINTGAVGHTLQQSRKAAFHGPYVELLDDLAHNEHFLKIQKRSAPDADKEYDRELALRFFAMHRSSNQFKAPMFKFLNQEIKQHQKAERLELERLRRLFKDTTATVWQIWGELACRDPIKDPIKGKDQFNASLWDAGMVAVGNEVEHSPKRRKELTDRAAVICQSYLQLLQDDNFKKNLSTTSRANVMRRIDLMKDMLRKAAPESRDQVRAFSKSTKQQLWEAASSGGSSVLCGLCDQVIHQASDAEVDHITPWSHGGKTHASNAQLVHRLL